MIRVRHLLAPALGAALAACSTTPTTYSAAEPAGATTYSALPLTEPIVVAGPAVITTPANTTETTVTTGPGSTAQSSPKNKMGNTGR